MNTYALAPPNNEPIILRRLREACTIRGKSRSGFYADIAQGLMTKPVKLGGRCSGWPSNEIDAINRARIAGKSDDYIKALVTQLEANRATLAPSIEVPA